MSTGTFDPHAAREAFEQFLFEMDDRIEWLVDLAEERGFDLDFTIDSLDSFEALIDSLIEEPVEGRDLTDNIITGARYLGEVIRETYGGKWDLPLDDPKYVSFNKPVITGHNDFGTEFDPILLVRSYTNRRQRGYLKRVALNQRIRYELDLTHLLKKEHTGEQ